MLRNFQTRKLFIDFYITCQYLSSVVSQQQWLQRSVLRGFIHSGNKETVPEDSSRARESPSKQSESPKQPSPTPSPKISPQPTPKTTKVHESTGASLTMTPPKSPHTSPLSFPSHSKDAEKVEDRVVVEERDSFSFSPRSVFRTPQTADVFTKSGEKQSDVVSTPSTNFLFSPPLTRSMIKRRSLDVSALGKSSSVNSTPNVSTAPRSLR